MIHLDTSALIDSLTGSRKSEPQLTKFVTAGQIVQISALVLYEWRRGPRDPVEIENQELLFPAGEAVSFGSKEALIAADLYRKMKRGRGREIDIAIAACALSHNARLWTLNQKDFEDIPGIQLL